MKPLEIYPEMTLEHLRKHFSVLFPYLQLELVAEDSVPEKVQRGQTMDELAGTSPHCCFLIEGAMSVADLEADFRECYGLTVRISRWSGYAWHDTDDTRCWSLDQQNDKGAEMQTHS